MLTHSRPADRSRASVPVGRLMRLAGLAAPIVLTLACSDYLAPKLGEQNQFGVSSPPGAPRLVNPPAGALIPQNSAATGCTQSPTRGYGFRIDFDWDEVPGASRYLLVMQRVSASIPAVAVNTTRTEYSDVKCGAFVIDANLEGWRWRVAALRPVVGGVGVVDTVWSEERDLKFARCRLSSGASCYAPPRSSSP